MTENYIRNVVEAALLAAGRPLQLNELAQLFDESTRPEQADLRAALDALQADYSARGIEVKETANGFRIQVKRELANEVSRLWPERPPRYSRALLETLALIAYRQPITRAEIEAVRGVAVNPNIIKTVLERGWVRVVGTRDVPGRPELLGTTKEFLDYFGLRSLEDLPPLAELKAMGEINLQLDLAKPGDGGSEGGSGSEGSGGAGGAAPADGHGSGGTGSAVAAAAAVGAVAVAAGLAQGASDSESAGSDSASGVGDAVAANDALEAGSVEGSDGASVAQSEGADGASASESASGALAVSAESGFASESEAVGAISAASGLLGEEAAPQDAQQMRDVDAVAPAAEAEDVVVAEAAPATSADEEAESGDVTVEVETLGLVEARIEASIEGDEVAEVAPREDAAIETGEFELAELGMSTPPAASVIEAEFDADDLENGASEEDASDDEEELSAGPQSSTELVASPPRDRDD
jgi:segregation and condensation protein B